MTGLYDLPSELLFHIINMVITSPLPVPSGGKRYRPAWTPSGRQTSCFPSKSTIEAPNAMNLLLSSQRLYSETQLCISKTPQTFKLDVAVVNNHWLWPTWRSIPVRTTHAPVDRVEVTLVLCCTEDQVHMSTTWAHLAPHTELLHILRYFVTQHPLPVPVNTLVIDIDTTKYDNGQNISEEIVPLRRIHDLAHLDFEILLPVDADNSRRYQHRLIRMVKDMVESWRLSDDHGNLCSGLGKILFCIDGEYFKEINIAAP